MINLKRLAVLAASVAALVACTKNATSQPSAAADEAAIRAVNTTWFKAYNGGDGAAVAALYAEDAVLTAPGAPAARGTAAIRAFYVKEVAAFKAAGLVDVDGPTSEVGVSGDLAWQAGTFEVTAKSGWPAHAGRYLSVLQRKDGKWMIIRNTWNSDAEPLAAWTGRSLGTSCCA